MALRGPPDALLNLGNVIMPFAIISLVTSGSGMNRSADKRPATLRLESRGSCWKLLQGGVSPELFS